MYDFRLRPAFVGDADRNQQNAGDEFVWNRRWLSVIRTAWLGDGLADLRQVDGYIPGQFCSERHSSGRVRGFERLNLGDGLHEENEDWGVG